MLYSKKKRTAHDGPVPLASFSFGRKGKELLARTIPARALGLIVENRDFDSYDEPSATLFYRRIAFNEITYKRLSIDWLIRAGGNKRPQSNA